VAATSALLGAATMALVAASPAQAEPREWETCDSYQSRELHSGYLRVPSTEDEELRCVLQEGDRGRGVRVLKTALRECYGQRVEDDGYFDDQTERALRRVQRRLGLEEPEGVYSPRTLRAGFEFTIFEYERGWDTTERCRAWEWDE
jgi:hypothetical protein